MCHGVYCIMLFVQRGFFDVPCVYCIMLPVHRRFCDVPWSVVYYVACSRGVS